MKFANNWEKHWKESNDDSNTELFKSMQFEIIKTDCKFKMFFLFFEQIVKKIKNRLRRLQKRRCTIRKEIFNDKIVKEAYNEMMNLIKELGYLAKVKLISETEKADIIKYLEEASYVLDWNFSNDFARECVPHQLTEDDLFYLDQCTNLTLEEMNGPL